MMLVRLALLLHGIDLRDPSDRARVPEQLHDLAFEASEGLTYVVLHCDDREAPRVAAQVARRIERALEGVTVVGVYDELVSLTDVAVRAEVAHESVRLWAAGKRRAGGRPFPHPRQVVGAQRGRNSTKLYMWREVVGWIREVIHLDPDEGVQFLTDRQLAEVNARVAQVMPAPGETVIGRVYAAGVRTKRVGSSLRFEQFMAESAVVLAECTSKPAQLTALR